MLQVRNLIKIMLCALLLIAAGCKSKDKDPFTTQGNVDDPQWTITESNNMPSSMTIIADVTFTSTPGILAAFINDQCYSKAEMVNGLYFLYVSPPADNVDGIELRFYSPELKRIFIAEQLVPYVNGNIVGSTSEPYQPTWKVAESGK